MYMSWASCLGALGQTSQRPKAGSNFRNQSRSNNKSQILYIYMKKNFDNSQFGLCYF